MSGSNGSAAAVAASTAIERDVAPRIVGIGLATPLAQAHQQQSARLATEVTLADPAQRALVQGLYARAGVERRGSVILGSTTPAEGPLDQQTFASEGEAEQPWPTTGERMALFSQHAGPLSVRAAHDAFAQSGTRPDEITHLITVSCTGMAAPGVDVELMQHFGLSSGTQRLNLGFMGCHGGIVALRTAAALVRGQGSGAERACVLAVCTELCTLHLQRTSRADQHVANALFGDGAAAVIVRGGGEDGGMSAGARRPTIRASSSMLFAESTNAMGWSIGDHGFEMVLDRSVPGLLESKLSDWIWPWLRAELGADVRAGDVCWAVHPGGPRVLDAVERALGLGASALAASRDVLREHGNMSSATVLFILSRAGLLGGTAHETRPTVLLGFGPGLTGEAALLEA